MFQIRWKLNENQTKFAFTLIGNDDYSAIFIYKKILTPFQHDFIDNDALNVNKYFK